MRLARVRDDEAWPLAIGALIFLPYLPGPIPSAFMLWQGPLEVAVWILVAAGLCFARVARAGSGLGAAIADPARMPWIAAAVVAVFSTLAFYQVRSVVPSGDEPHYLVATQSLIADGDLKVENNYAAGDYLTYFAGRLQPHFLRRSSAGEIYSIHAPGVSLIVLPAFLIGGHAGAALTVIALAALCAALTWAVAWHVSQSAAAAWVGVLAVFATAPFAFHSFTIYPDGAGALLVIAAVWLFVRLDDAEWPRPVSFLLVGAGLALLPWLHTRFALLAGVFGAAVLARLVVRRASAGRIAAFLSVPIVAAAAWFGFFWMIWGTPSPLAPYGRDTESSLAYVARGLAGLVFDQQHGVVGTAPIYAIAALGLWPLWRQRRALALTIAAALSIYGVAVSTYPMWWGGSSAPARFVAAILPLAAVLIAAAWKAYPRLRIATLLLLIISITLMLPRLSDDAGRFVFNSRGAVDPTIEWLVRNVDFSLALPSGHRDGPGQVVLDAIPWLCALAVIGWTSIAASRSTASAGLKWTLTAGAAAASVMAATGVVWMMRGAQPATPDRSMLAALSARRAFHSIYVAVDGRRRIDGDAAYLASFSLPVPARDAAALLRLARVPAGEYELTMESPRPEGKLAVVVGGRNDSVIDAAAADRPFRLTLPAGAANLSIRVDTQAPDGEPGFRLRPIRIDPSCCPRLAVRAARYGSMRVFFLDDRAYPEAAGFWTRGEGQAAVVIDADPESKRTGRVLALRAGAAATTIGISSTESQSMSLTPGQQRTFRLPPIDADRTWSLEIHSGPGFRPFRLEPNSSDVRLLAAWFEIP